MQKYTFLPKGMVQNTLYLEVLQMVPMKGELLPHLDPRANTYSNKANKATKNEKYPWLDEDEKRRYITDREITKLEGNLKDLTD